MITKADAQVYCHWLSKVTGKAYSLPNQGTVGEGCIRDGSAQVSVGKQQYQNRTLCNIEHWYGGTTPVGQFSPDGDGPEFDNTRGCAEMVGNVSEWTLSTYTSSTAIHIECDPDFCYYKTNTYDFVGGASWQISLQSCRNVNVYDHVRDDIGFRVVVHPPPEQNLASRTSQ